MYRLIPINIIKLNQYIFSKLRLFYIVIKLICQSSHKNIRTRSNELCSPVFDFFTQRSNPVLSAESTTHLK